MEWENAKQLIYMRNTVSEKGEGGRAKIKHREAGGNTGITQAMRDAWFVGFTADYVIGVWMGYDDSNPLKGVSCGGLPDEIWQRLMMKMSRDLPSRPLPMINLRMARLNTANDDVLDIDASGLFKKVKPGSKLRSILRSLFARPEED